jgi:iron complex outermembrane receptor protein
VLCSNQVWAADAEVQVARTSTGLEEIVVTAQRREERAQDVPLAITAFDAEALSRIGFTNLSDLMENVPSLAITPYPNASSSLVVFMRGVGQIDAVQIARDPGVGIYADDVYLARGSALTADLGDIERVEVLRGPQGTLYGRNTIGGAVKFISAKPTGKFGIKETLDIGNFGYVRSLTNLNLPEMAGVSAKLTYLRSDTEGYVDNPGSSRDFGEKRQQGVRAALRWRPADAWVLDYVYDYSDQDGVSLYEQRQYLFPAVPVCVSAAAQACRSVLAHRRSPDRGRLHGEWARADRCLGALSRRVVEVHQRVSGARCEPAPRHRGGVQSASGQSTRCRAAPVFPGAAAERRTECSRDPISPGRLLLYGNWPAAGTKPGESLRHGIRVPVRAPDTCGPRSGRCEQCRERIDRNLRRRELDPRTLDAFTLNAGGRYSRDTRDAERVGSPAADTDYSRFDPSFTVDYRWTDELHTYARYATAYRAGGFNLLNSNLSPFEPEKLTSYELGLKAQWLDRRLRTNLAAFWQTYEDMQLDFIDPATQQVYTLNAGEATFDGVEGEFEFLPTDALRISADVTYMYARQSGEIINPFTQTPVFGTSLPNAPKWKYNANIQYTFPPSSVGTFSMLVGYSFRDEETSNGGPGSAGDPRPSYDLVNARLALSDISLGRGRLSLALWGNNLADDEYQYYHNFGAAIIAQPRSYGINMVYHYE